MRGRDDGRVIGQAEIVIGAQIDDIATLADTCFAYACNSYDEATVASGFGIDLLAMVFGMPRALFPVLSLTVFHAGAQGTGFLFAAVSLLLGFGWFLLAVGLALTVLGAEYVLGLLPKGTHDYARFIRPSELARWCRDAAASCGPARWRCARCPRRDGSRPMAGSNRPAT